MADMTNGEPFALGLTDWPDRRISDRNLLELTVGGDSVIPAREAPYSFRQENKQIRQHCVWF
jgi:hypothetical protein